MVQVEPEPLFPPVLVWNIEIVGIRAPRARSCDLLDAAFAIPIAVEVVAGGSADIDRFDALVGFASPIIVAA